MQPQPGQGPALGASPAAARPAAPSPNGLGASPPPLSRLRRRPTPLLIVAVLVLALAGFAVWLALPPAGPGALTASGTVEYDEVTLAAEAAGRLADLSVGEGSHVVEGQVVGHLTDPVLSVQGRQALVDPAQQQVTQAQLSRLDLTAPIGGVVQKQIAHRGEYVAPGSPILTVADPTDLKLTLYVLEADLGRVAVGQSVGVHADAFPERVFTGHVTTIADKAEFTPRNVQTQKDRRNLVFAVTVRVPNPDAALKAGLPVDATFGP
ncbi:MAG TPA: efflux RND transporter periplasmic adaptor subunit [Chloroflexota bacterium]